MRTLCEWLLTPGQSYKKTRKLCEEEFGVSPSDSQLSRFYQRYVAAELIRRRRLAVTVSSEIAAEVKRQPGAFDPATIDALQQKAFELASAPQVDPSDVKSIFALVLKARDQDMKQQEIGISMRRLELLESANRQARELVAKAKTKGGISPETLEEIERSLKVL